MRRQQGFSLIELVMVIIILTIAGVSVLGQFAQIGPAIVANEPIQTAAQLAQERAEEILAQRRAGTLSDLANGTSNDTLPANYSQYGRSVDISAYAGSACPVASCKQVTVTVTANGTPRSVIEFVVADY